MQYLIHRIRKGVLEEVSKEEMLSILGEEKFAHLEKHLCIAENTVVYEIKIPPARG